MRQLYQQAKNSSLGKFIIAVATRYSEARVALLAAGLAYYAAFSLGPLTLIFAGFFAGFLQDRPDLALQYQTLLIDLLEQVLPFEVDTQALVSSSFTTIVNQLSEAAFLRNVLSFLVLLWASSNFFTVLQQALETIFDVEDTRGYWRKRAVAILLVFSVLAVIVVEAIGVFIGAFITDLMQTFSLWLSSFNLFLPTGSSFSGLSLTELLRSLIVTVVLTLCFRFLPRYESSWLPALFGSLFCVLGIRVTQVVFAIVFNPEQFSLIYGVITSLLVILLWLYVAIFVVLLGALLTAILSDLSEARQQKNRAL